MKLAALLNGIATVEVAGPTDVDVVEVRDDSRKVGPGDLFIAVPAAVPGGHAENATDFVADAARRGARVLVVERGAPAAALPFPRGTRVTVPSVREALAPIAANRFPRGRELILTAVTGTNGKTTTTYLIEEMLRAAGIVAGVIGTVAYRVGGAGAAALMRDAPLTTPGALALHHLLDDMRNVGAEDVVLEASSHALDQRRLDGCRFRVAGLTNLTQDHLDYHRTMDAYLDAKAILFERLLDGGAGVAVLPFDRPEGLAMRARVRGRPVLGVATRPLPGADIVVETVTASSAGMRVRLATPLGALALESALVGGFNLENLVLAVGMAVARGLDANAIVEGIRRLPGVPGRLERVANGRGVLCVVDYAHTPDALERAIAAVRPLVGAGARMITMFGCGGDRDRTKRPLMGEVAARDSDLAIVTSDNPRTEAPGSIVDMILEGVRRQPSPPIEAAALSTAERGVCAIVDRRAAIRATITAARAGDVVLLAGKGHEDYQIVGTEKLHFDDREEARSAFAVAEARA
ncbi:MAG TPA: UDP-N-acetylmuramoyl-L-alanyl-D-glutamate--2,6-diaminopimelate ligase [Polyangia bacterium]|jgi:UDP-N-acetylmuramoyl-L-alanyl-D-glutamate--2,6-diaminopimelate ligase